MQKEEWKFEYAAAIQMDDWLFFFGLDVGREE